MTQVNVHEANRVSARRTQETPSGSPDRFPIIDPMDSSSPLVS